MNALHYYYKRGIMSNGKPSVDMCHFLWRQGLEVTSMPQPLLNKVRELEKVLFATGMSLEAVGVCRTTQLTEKITGEKDH